MDFLLIALLTLLNGVFAMSELALASSRKARLTAMAESGDKGARASLALLDNPTRFLSSVQVGITSIGMLNGIIGEAAFSDDLAVWLLTLGLPGRAAEITATALVVTIITFITIVFGELVPKRIGQLYPETVSRMVAVPMTWVATIATNSGKYAHYGPPATGKAFHFASLARCVEAACSGRIDRTMPVWCSP